MPTLPNRLREVRNSRQQAQQAVSAKGGVSSATLTAIEVHDLLPGPDVRQRIADALGVEVKEIWPDLK